jgi:hypothetical protein
LKDKDKIDIVNLNGVMKIEVEREKVKFITMRENEIVYEKKDVEDFDGIVDTLRSLFVPNVFVMGMGGKESVH